MTEPDMTVHARGVFPVEGAAATPEDENLLTRWCRAHLADCEKWLARRGLAGVANGPLHAARVDPAGREVHAAGLEQAVADFAARRRGAPAGPGPVPAESGLATLAERLGTDLRLYRDSLAKGGVNRIRLVPVEHSVIPLFLVETYELFYPRHLAAALPRQLFAVGGLFSVPRPASTSWVVFQTPVLAVRERVLTVAQSLDILEYDYP